MFVIRCLTEEGWTPFPTQYEMMLVTRLKQNGVNLNAKLEPYVIETSLREVKKALNILGKLIIKARESVDRVKYLSTSFKYCRNVSLLKVDSGQLFVLNLLQIVVLSQQALSRLFQTQAVLYFIYHLISFCFCFL